MTALKGDVEMFICKMPIILDKNLLSNICKNLIFEIVTALKGDVETFICKMPIILGKNLLNNICKNIIFDIVTALKGDVETLCRACQLLHHTESQADR